MRNSSVSTPQACHELQGPVDVAGHQLVALVGGVVAHEALVPCVHLPQVGEAALGEGAHEVQCRGRGVVDLQEPVGIRGAGGRGELQAVDGVTPVRRERHAVTRLRVLAARLGELAGKPADLDHRHLCAVGEHDSHLQQRLDLVPDRVGAGVGERLGAVPALEQERLASGHRREALGQRVALAREHQRGQGTQPVDDVTQRDGVGPRRSLRRVVHLPSVGVTSPLRRRLQPGTPSPDVLGVSCDSREPPPSAPPP